jgi:hypothetical protein
MKLQAVREGNGASRWDLFVKTGVHTSKIGLIEDGYRVATENDKATLSKALGVEVTAIDWPKGENHGKWRWR